MIPAQAHAKLSGLDQYLVLIISALHESHYFAVMEGRVKIAIGLISNHSNTFLSGMTVQIYLYERQ